MEAAEKLRRLDKELRLGLKGEKSYEFLRGSARKAAQSSPVDNPPPSGTWPWSEPETGA